MDEYCEECGAKMKDLGDINQTKILLCSECFSEKTIFVSEECEHEYSSRDECMYCGKER
jgi:hypothetical protein